ncbi:MAG: alpha/beta hydrolase, partial [Candidatus Dormibacteraceae bacterium]
MTAFIAVLAFAVGGAVARGPLNSSSAGGANPWVDQQVSFQAGGVTVYGTFRHPSGHSAAVPAALIIAGSGPTDRNGNSNLVSGSIDTLQTVADWLSADGVASLRYDKLGTGQTGLGAYASNPASIGLVVYAQEAAAALTFLAKQPGVDRNKLAVFGHSEGGLFALLLASGKVDSTPPIHALGLLEPLSIRYLDHITNGFDASVAAAKQAGQLTPAHAANARAVEAGAVESLRTSGTVQPNLPYGLSNLLSPSSARFLAQAD